MNSISNFSKRLLIIALMFTLAACSKDSPVGSEVIINTPVLTDAYAQAEQFSGLKSLVVAKDGAIIKERYWGTARTYTTHDVRSVTKTVTGLLIGIAIDKGFIQSVDQTIGEFLTPLYPNMSQDKANIKIRHLLTMSSGFSWNELSSAAEYGNWFNSPNQVQYILDRPLAAKPGQTFTYNSAALHLLSVILTRATNMSTYDFASQYLFSPLGMGQTYWEKDHQGYNNGAAGLNINPHDMIKIGQLILNRGEFNGQRIVSSQWIDQECTTQISTKNSQPYGPAYGFGLWIGQNANGNFQWANGYGGQFIVIVPYSRLVVVATNEWNNVNTTTANNRWNKTIDLIMKSIVPVFN